MAENKSIQVGRIVGGSLSEGLVLRIDDSVDPVQVCSGRFVCIKDGTKSFFSIISDLTLESSDQSVLADPPGAGEELFAQIYRKKFLFKTAQIKPMLVLENGLLSGSVRTIPGHFSPVFLASDEDIERVFGQDGAQNGRFLHIGSPIGMQAKVCMDLSDFADRSNGIFGKTGTGKTFITRTILAGMIKSEQAVNLIFDMHSEYGGQARSEDGKSGFVKGLKNLMPEKIAVFSLDPESTSKRGLSPDVTVNFSLSQIGVEDVIVLADELLLHPTAFEAAFLLSRTFGRDWLAVLLDSSDKLKELAAQIGAHSESLSALYRKLKRIERFSFIKKGPVGRSIAEVIVEYLDRGINVVLEFGRHSSLLAYLLVSGIITREIHRSWVAKTETFLASKDAKDRPRKLIITIEEAHKFLSPQAAKQTIFGMIAREMRKYFVSLFVVDQRPSGIDSEVLSQLGTRIVCQLSDERDIAAVLTGARNASEIRAILSTLGPKKEAVIMGYAVPMPVAIVSRDYDEKFFASISAPIKSTNELSREIY